MRVARWLGRVFTPRRSALFNRVYKVQWALTAWWLLWCSALVALRMNGLAGSVAEDLTECCLWLGFPPYLVLIRHAWIHYRRGEHKGACGDPECGPW